MLVICKSCEEEFEVDETKLPHRKVKSKCMKCGAWIYLRGEDPGASSLVEVPDITTGVQLIEKGQYDQAEEFFQNILKVTPSPDLRKSIIESYLVLGSDKASLGHFQQAEEVIRRALKLFPEDPNLWGMLGDVQSDQHQFNQSKESYQKALALDPNDEKYYIGLANVYKNLRLPEEEVNIYKKALRVLSKNSLLYFKLGQALFYNGDFINSLQSIKTALQLDKNNKAAVRFLNKGGAIKEFAKGVGYFKKKSFKEAMECFQKVQSTLISYPLLPYYQGVAHYMLRQFSEAIGCLEKYLHLDAHGPKTEKAISFLQRAIKELQGMEINVILQPLDKCHLIIKTVPSKANLFLDDKKLGLAPQNLNGIAAGSHVLKATLDTSELEVPLIFSGGIAYKITINLSQKDFKMEPSLDYEVIKEG